MLVSTRRSIVYPNPTRTDTADVPRDFLAVINALEIDVVYGQGTLVARPAAGLQGRIYCASDQTPKQFYWDDGATWNAMGTVTAGAIRGSTTGDVQQEILQGSIRRVDLSAQLKPSGSAVAADEALRALGATASTAAAGNDARLSDTRVPTAGSVTAASGAAGAFAGQSYGTVFPSSGLYNGYRFTLFLTNPAGGSCMYDAIYRADLDATYPWHVTGPPVTSAPWSITSVSGAYAVMTGTGYTTPRAGAWQVRFGGLSGGGVSGSQTINATVNIPSLGTLQAQGPVGGFSASVETEGTVFAVASGTVVSLYGLNTQPANSTSLVNGYLCMTPIKLS